MNCVTRFISLVVLPFNIYGQVGIKDLPDYNSIPQNCVIQPYMNRVCCFFPPFFNRETARSCGGKTMMLFTNRANMTGYRRGSELGCRYWRCLLKKYDLLSYDGKRLDDQKYFEHLSSWVELNVEFKKVILRAKLECKQAFKPSLPMRVCDFYQLNSCVRNFVNVNCPQYLNTTECSEVKRFYSECAEFYQ